MTDENMFAQTFALRSPQCIAEIVDGEAVIINLDNGNYYNLQGKSVEVWMALNQGVTPERLLEFNQWDQAATVALERFLKLALDEGILAAATGTGSIEATQRIGILDPSKDFAIAVYSDMQELLGLDPIHETDEVIGWPEKK